MRTGRSVRAQRLYASRVFRPTGRSRRRHTAHFGASAQQKSALRRSNRLSASASLLFGGCPLYSTTPRSLQRRTGGLLLDRSFQYALPLAFLECRSDAGVIGELRGLPIHKTSLHADVCSGCYQNLILVWLIIVRYVSSLGQSGVSLFEEFLGFRTVQGFLGISELTSPWDSLLSCDYNVQ